MAYRHPKPVRKTDFEAVRFVREAIHQEREYTDHKNLHFDVNYAYQVYIAQHYKAYTDAYVMGHSGRLMPCVRKVAGSNPTLAAT